MAIGCKDLNLTVWDLEKKTEKWRGKTPPPDELELMPKLDIRAIQNQDSTYYALSAFNEVYIYDIRAKRKMVSSF